MRLNVGLAETKNQAQNALPKGSFGFGGNGGTVFNKNNNEFLTWVRRNNVSSEFFRNSAPSDYTYRYGAGILLKAADTYASLSVDYSTARVKVIAGNNSGNVNSPVRELAFTDESYTKPESDDRFIRSNVNTKTSGYILSKTANYLEDANSRHLGSSGFLRPNGMDNLGDLTIHVAHPSVEGPQHARGISFSYGSNSNGFGISTYAFDKDGKFQGQKKILTEDDVTSLISERITKSEAESKYQPRGNYQPAGNYQSAGNYQPIGNYTLKGDCYTKGESDSRYLSFQNRSPRTVLSGVSLNDGETANLGVDCRGKIMWVWCTEPEYSAVMTVIPIDNYGVSTHYGYQGSIDLTLINGGRTIKVIYTRKDTRLWRIDIWD